MNKYSLENIRRRLYKKRLIDSNNCWVWKGAVRNEYGSIRIGPSMQPTHRVSMMLHKDFDLQSPLLILHKDAVCRNRLCFNPEHLYIGTQKDNIRDAISLGTFRFNKSLSNGNTKKTHCPQGHEYNEENTLRYGGKRYCKECRSLASNKGAKVVSRVSVATE